MEQFRLDIHDLPTSFHRVQYPGSQTTYNESGLSARDTTSFYPEDRTKFRDSVAEAFKWSSRIPSPYVAVFSEKDHAQNWALRWTDRNGPDCEVVTIDSRELDGVYIFKLSTIVDELNIALPNGASQHEKGAYLCLHRVPAKAVQSSESTSSIRASKIANTQVSGFMVLISM